MVEIQKIREFYDGYLDELTNENNRHKWILNSIDRFIPKGRVLDLGCGTGITSRHLAKGERDVVAVDLSPKLIEYAVKMNSHFGRVEYIVDDISKCVWPEPFDSILMVDVLEHILPESVDKLFANLKLNSHENTLVYLNIPTANKILHSKENSPECLQIIDNPISVGDTLEWFDKIGFVPAYFQLYGAIYIEYLFVTKERYNKKLKGAF